MERLPRGFLAEAYRWSRKRTELLASPPRPTSLRQAVERAVGQEKRPALIIEYKRCSPRGFVAYHTPWSYLEATLPVADAYSVLVEPYWFCGSLELVAFFAQHRPVVAKDFPSSRAQLEQYQRAGASAALLILDMLGWKQLDTLYQEARSLGLEALIETHRAEDAVEAMNSYPEALVGINARNLETLEISYQRLLEETARAAARKPSSALLVAESSIDSAEKAARLAEAGADALLIGTWAMKRTGELCSLPERLKGTKG
ncbi:indole-3-glycerol-phosphate synthase [Pyrodictium abyssi]|uniref:Indole-3-glycerol phosphate synthase n=1 Tax=Pyrodictium abyssi TaxID=54256 RepID=A0ABN6ZP51_9CREN|nr:indole-3-glycerol phosphate synthase TrpC [Pyrodictium abyssi]